MSKRCTYLIVIVMARWGFNNVSRKECGRVNGKAPSRREFRETESKLMAALSLGSLCGNVSRQLFALTLVRGNRVAYRRRAPAGLPADSAALWKSCPAAPRSATRRKKRIRRPSTHTKKKKRHKKNLQRHKRKGQKNGRSWWHQDVKSGPQLAINSASTTAIGQFPAQKETREKKTKQNKTTRENDRRQKISHSYHGQSHPVDLVLVFRLVLAERRVPFEQFVQHASETEPIGARVVRRAL